MKLTVLLAVLAMGLCACSGSSGTNGRSDAADGTVFLDPVEVGDKNDLFEVVGKDRIKLAPGVTVKPVKGPGDSGTGMVLMRPNGIEGGYVSCTCVGATSGACGVSSDNPDNDPVCTGGCRDSEGVARSCQMEGKIGPPKDPKWLRFRWQE